MNQVRGWMGAAACALALTKPGVALADTETDRLTDAFFGGRSAMSADLTRMPQWSALLAREDKQAVADAAPKPSGKSRGETSAPVHAISPDLRAELERVQRDFNAAAYQTDQRNWGVADYWATTSELRARGGDCEDFATAKYFALRALGIAAEDMRVAIVVDDVIAVRHALLLVRIGDEIYALDNRHDRIVRAAELAHYRPLMAMNEAAWWLAAEELRQTPGRSVTLAGPAPSTDPSTDPAADQDAGQALIAAAR